MNVQIEKLKIKGDKTLLENQLPYYRDKLQSKELVDAGLLKEELEHYGEQTGDRVLPYLMQDVYSRKLDELELKSIVLENENIKATFLPDYGMRLYSLYDKTRSKELLYVNPILRFANLAIRRAWFSGGIEWNIGQLGHTFTTCEPMHVAKLVDVQGNEFLRAFDYERCKGIFWAMDFHLPKGAKQLAVYVKIINDKKEAVPMYWWTNAAVDDRKDVRVLSGNKNVIFIDETSNQGSNKKGMAHGEMPCLNALKNKDASYPQNFEFSCEYFFQNEARLDQAWEAAVYNDNKMYYERSSENLRFRKMFCWGEHRGGKHWQEFLTQKDTPGYLELQAGLAPTQVHGLEMPAKTQWDFVQFFGGCDFDYKAATGDWGIAKNNVYKHINAELSEQQVEQILADCRKNFDSAKPEIIHKGNGFGAVEKAFGTQIPKGFCFAEDTITKIEKPWISLVETGEMPEIGICEPMGSFMVDLRFKELLIKAAKKGSYTAYNHLGVMYNENQMSEKAFDAFSASNNLCENPFACRNLYFLANDKGEVDAIKYYDKVIELLNNNIKREYAEEYINALCKVKRYKKAKEFYDSLSCEVKNGDRVLLNMFEVVAQLNDLEFMEKLFEHEFAVVREGERSVSDYYFIYQAMCEARANNTTVTEDMIAKYIKENDIPFELDFRLTVV